MLLYILHQQFQRFFQLRIASRPHQIGTVIDDHVRLDAVVLDQPLAVEAVERKLRPGDVTAIHQGGISADTAHSAPGAHPNHRPQLVELKKICKEIAVRGGVLIAYGVHVTVKNGVGYRAGRPITRGLHARQHAPEPFKDNLVHKAAAVKAHVEDQTLLANLGKELAHELIEPVVLHIGDVDVAHAAIAGEIDFTAVGFYPVELAQMEFARNRPHHHVAGPLLGGRVIDRECYGLAGSVKK